MQTVADLERRVIAYVDEHEAEGVQLLRDLVRIKSLARQEGRVDQPGTLLAFLRAELGREGGVEIVAQPLGSISQNLIEVLRAPMLGERPMLISYAVTLLAAVGGWAFAFVFFAHFRRRIAYWL